MHGDMPQCNHKLTFGPTAHVSESAFRDRGCLSIKKLAIMGRLGYLHDDPHAHAHAHAHTQTFASQFAVSIRRLKLIHGGMLNCDQPPEH